MKYFIQQALANREKRSITANSFKPAAVLVPLFEADGNLHVLFTRRTQKVEHHKGQISFPGGAWEEGDGELRVTALRETREEIGMGMEDVEILGELDDAITRTNFHISPFVGFIPYPYPFKVNEYEIEELITVPLDSLLDKNSFREAVRVQGRQVYQLYFYQYGEHLIWGATAGILKQFLDVVKTEEPSYGPYR